MGRILAPVDVICGGFPCQDLSVAGRRAGLAGERSGLFYEFMRIVGEVAPRWVLIENVPGLLSSNGGRDMGAVLGTLGQLGYWWTWRVLDSQYFGVAQRRRRVFIVGHLGAPCPPEVLFEPESLPGHPPTRGTQGEGVAGSLGGGSGSRGRADDTDRMTFVPDVAFPVLEREGKGPASSVDSGNLVAHTFNASDYRNGRYDADDNARPLTTSADRTRAAPLVAHMLRENYRNNSDPSAEAAMHILTPTPRRLTPRECERLQGFPDDWTRYADDGKEITDGPRYRMLGNAVTVNVAEWIARRIVAL
jgi:DNA (cytosine-5)-methyltransferase 1